MKLTVHKDYVEVTDLGLAEARELFGEASVEEVWGTIRVSCSIGKVRRVLRDAGHRTELTK